MTPSFLLVCYWFLFIPSAVASPKNFRLSFLVISRDYNHYIIIIMEITPAVHVLKVRVFGFCVIYINKNGQQFIRSDRLLFGLLAFKVHLVDIIIVASSWTCT